ncbi:type II secretion system protein GspG [Solemya pervernicosa gill symbiont]|uniref:Type II secretion system core protein G n=1 Tax=Solemya pervernicosa gill symbiont TaxID=642797 RepID=A0A1T2L2C0_9GAMM|nr:type II secretion system major pseudopilin GspG [Solemya pervernicosa gill symbiont]OOZ39170.1 type II secretion system protein GspG [Solemya pervernicosa gill symbiont]
MLTVRITEGNREFPVQRKQHGFTLIEILVVVVILGILASVVIPKIMDEPDAAKKTKAQFDIRSLETALDRYRLDNHHYPTTDQGLDALVSKPSDSPEPRNWKSGGYIARLPQDPWGSDYQYLNPGVRNAEIDIFSYGADNQPDGEGNDADIGNWE